MDNVDSREVVSVAATYNNYNTYIIKLIQDTTLMCKYKQSSGVSTLHYAPSQTRKM